MMLAGHIQSGWKEWDMNRAKVGERPRDAPSRPYPTARASEPVPEARRPEPEATVLKVKESGHEDTSR